MGTIARRLVADKGAADVTVTREAVAVDGDLPCRDAARHAAGTLNVSRIDRSCEAVGGIVGELDSALLIACVSQSVSQSVSQLVSQSVSQSVSK